MAHSMPADNGEGARIVLGLLESVERDGEQSQRRLATELGIALGLVNAYVKRCVKKGLLKMRQVPAGRYAYYLTPSGFAEKSRLTLEFLSYSFSFFRQARADCAATFANIRECGFTRVVLFGCSDLTEVATICALESQITIIAVVDRNASGLQFLNLPLVKSFDEVRDKFDAVFIAALTNARAAKASACAAVGDDRVFVPQLLETQIRPTRKVQ
jgi:DNA-binding MarR family transcriptional regulator